MKYVVHISEEAEKDLHSIYEYIAVDLFSPKAALNQLTQIEKQILTLNFMPERYKKYNDEIANITNLRIMSVNNFCFFYNVNEAESKVSVIRVLYGRCDFSKHLS